MLLTGRLNVIKISVSRVGATRLCDTVIYNKDRAPKTIGIS